MDRCDIETNAAANLVKGINKYWTDRDLDERVRPLYVRTYLNT